MSKEREGKAAEADKEKIQMLAESTDMAPVQGTVDVDIPVDVLWNFFTQANLWPRWNKCFTWVHNRDLQLGRQLVWCFEPIRKWYPYKMPAIAKIVEVEEGRKVTWEVSAFPGMYARHTYHMEDLGNGRTRFGSWEKGTGSSFRRMMWLWLPHFTFVKDRSLEGARYLEQIYRRTGRLDESTVGSKRSNAARLAPLALLPLAVATAYGRRMYTTYVQQPAIRLAPGVHAVLNAGSNSLVVNGGSEVLLMDPKFPPHSKRLRGWIEENVGAEVTKIINTHYHYDHTQGNVLYPRATIYAHENMKESALTSDHNFSDSGWWEKHRAALPSETVSGKRNKLRVGSQVIELLHLGHGHTRGDLVVYLPEHEIVATGDLLFHTFYPYIDPSRGGASLDGWIKALRKLAAEHRYATFVPGHGPIATAKDLEYFANYLEALQNKVKSAIKNGLSEDEAVKKIDLSAWKMRTLPSVHKNKLEWSSVEKNIRTVYGMLA